MREIQYTGKAVFPGRAFFRESGGRRTVAGKLRSDIALYHGVVRENQTFTLLVAREKTVKGDRDGQAHLLGKL